MSSEGQTHNFRDVHGLTAVVTRSKSSMEQTKNQRISLAQAQVESLTKSKTVHGVWTLIKNP